MENINITKDGHFINRTPPLEIWCLLSYNDLIHKRQMTENIQKYPDVNRVEVISSEGEEFFWDEWDECSKVQVSFHNDGKTLKVFLVKELQK